MKVLQSLRKPHVTSVVIYLVVAVAFILQMKGMKLHSLLVPLICVATIATCAVTACMFRDEDEAKLSTNSKEVVTMLSIIVYAILIFICGFYLASIVYALFIFLHLSGWTSRSFIFGLMNAIGIVVLIYVLFNLFLDYFIPEGLMFQEML